ncbi:uncharacterized protein NECHADRAFT_89091 [Fusarium vanettenii 77-13-4]|uniref:Zn(2)-C6 fungal-type domain-containing protein n=1 Tax=Fusarium vanettenii (strain ATCC MYA-4622 / CBS 123669 / FGSC 9596 / NRRL 45880 / 77-13-4) TaxID=660122 RepID=C7ZQ72_FUSV7|nr:uncharacterized protein NECHADRAFT_89091 [Fusarium vanettenii 77-13-4]EEU33841.1 predicted protein [Fusarium vanettenii 77-13-4]
MDSIASTIDQEAIPAPSDKGVREASHPQQDVECDGRRPRCYNCERSRLYFCDGYGDVNHTNGNILSAQEVTDSVLSHLECLPSTSPSDRFQGSLPDVSTIDTDITSWGSFGEYMSIINNPHPLRFASDSPGEHTEGSNNLCNDGGLGETQDEATSPGVEVTPSSSFEAEVTSEATRKLLDHYRTHVCQLMMPTSAPSHNPWLQLYLPLAVKSPSSLPQQILLYAILAVASFNRSYLVPLSRVHDLKKGREYNERAVTHMRSILDSEDASAVVGEDKNARQALMAAALTLTTAEVFSGASQGDGYEHLQLCKQVIQITGGVNWWASDPACLTLLQIFRCLHIVASTSGRLEVVDLQPRDLQSAIIPAPVGDYTLDITFGVSIKTLQCLNKIIEFSKMKSTLGTNMPWPDDKISSLLELEDELFDPLEAPELLKDRHSFPSSDSQGGMPGYIADLITENHMFAFHYSAAIFFRRALCDGLAHISPAVKRSSEPKTRPTGQYLVSKALDHLENIDALSRNIAVANTLWPGFIAAVEAVDTDLRHRALIWLERAKRHGIGNIQQSKGIKTGWK